jgi:hypothetical protein
MSVLVGALLISACAGGSGVTSTTVTPAGSTTGSTGVGGEMEAASAAAVAQASADTGLGEGEFDVIDIEEVTWPDGSLGCPQPGMSYIQVVLEGYQVILEHEGDLYDYRSAQDLEFTRCPPQFATTTVP